MGSLQNELYEGIMKDDSSTVKALLANHPANSLTMPFHLYPFFLSINLKDTDKSGWTPLHVAAGSLNTEVTATLITSGGNINFASPACGRTALHVAVCTASSKASRILGVNTDCICSLLSNGANINTQDHEGQRAIQEACSGGRKETVDPLEKADMNSLTGDGQSPIFFLQRRSNLKDTALLNKFLGFSCTLERDNQGHPRTGLLFSEFQMLKAYLITLSQKFLSLQDICKMTVRRIYGENNEHWLKNRLPVTVWNSLYNYQDFGQ
ncbi:LOW QUALITY PROTEIN: ankyrin repeat domain-containing protein 61 [Morus bassanus]